MNKFYAYLKFTKPDASIPTYAGKGCGNRSDDHHKDATESYFADHCRKQLREDPDCFPITIRIPQPSERAAFDEEIRLIALHGRKNLGTGTLYNLTDGGEGTSGHIPSKETLAKRSATLKIVLNTPEVREKKRVSHTAANARPEVKAKISASLKIANLNPELNAKRSATLKKTNALPEVKARRSAAAKEVGARPEVKAKISAAAQESHARPEVKAKQKASLKITNARPEVIARRSAACKRMHLDQTASQIRYEKIKTTLNTPKVREKRSSAIKLALNSPEAKAKRAATESKPEIKIKRALCVARPCTIDNGTTVFLSNSEIRKVLGQGKDGSRSPNFRYLTEAEAERYWTTRFSIERPLMKESDQL